MPGPMSAPIPPGDCTGKVAVTGKTRVDHKSGKSSRWLQNRAQKAEDNKKRAAGRL